MKIIFIVIVSVIIIGSIISVGYFLFEEKTVSITPQGEVSEISNDEKLVDFSRVNSEFLFSAKIPKEFEVEYVSSIRAINIYNPSQPGDSNIEKSQMYLSFFKASKFLTLGTVEITRQDKMTIQGREAILYEITKKEAVPIFSGQPSWRNIKHQAIDIRLTQDSPSYFYSFAQNPNLPQKMFDDFINSLSFY